jgi:hypothetical protein
MRNATGDDLIFDAFMTANQRERAAAYAGAIDCRDIRHLVDVGGGEGAFLIELVGRNPNLRGTVLELPHAAARARETVRRERLEDRIAVVEGSFFNAVPRNADAYVLSAILHDWSDGDVVEILRACRAAMRRDSRLLVIEQVVAESGPVSRFAAELDIAMLVLLGGRERTRAEFASLFAAAGLLLRAVTPTRAMSSVLVAQPCDREL